MKNNKIPLPKGYKAAGIKSGAKASGKHDLGIVVSEKPASAAAVFTTNKFSAAPVVVSKEYLAKGASAMRGFIANSGAANACTGKLGIKNAKLMTKFIADQIKCKPENFLVASTGVIGKHLAMDKIEPGVKVAFDELSEDKWYDFATAICTTDTFVKVSSKTIKIKGKTVTITGTCKGAGMIHPLLATMLSFVVTDAAVSPKLLKEMLTDAADSSFNCLTIDGDTSTNDTLFLMANGMSGAPEIKKNTAEYKNFMKALKEVCIELAMQIARDGEGATKLVKITVKNAKNDYEAREAARFVANSNLVKTAIFGADPNWGRIICALGNSPATYVPEKVELHIGKALLFKNGAPTKFNEIPVSKYLRNKEIDIILNLKAGKASSTFYTCDLTYDYIKINADYRT